MYLRSTPRRNKDGSEVRYLQLAHNVWDPAAKRSRVQVVYNFGREEPGTREALERLITSVARHLDPGRTWPALAARFARLAHAGFLDIEDPDVAARQFQALVNAELQTTFMLGGTPTDDEVLQSARNGVRKIQRPQRRSRCTGRD